MISTPCQTISETLGDLFSCTTINNGFTRIRTPYVYLDGDVIDLFYKVTSEHPFLTDLGETIRWLLSQTVSNFLSQKQELISILGITIIVLSYKY